MERGAEYRKRFAQLSKDKVMLPRNAEGTPNTEAFTIVRDLSDALAVEPNYVGITLRGSIMHGYSTQASDIDVSVLFDSPTNDSPVIKRTHELIKEPRFENRHISPGMLNVNMQRWRESFERRDRSAEYVAAALCEVAESPREESEARIDAYREEIGEHLRSCSNFERNLFVRGVSTLLTSFDSKRMFKIEERMPEIEQNRKYQSEYGKARGELWEKRVRSIFHLP